VKNPPAVKCLIVDDMEENLLVLSSILADENVEVLQARSGHEALELLLVHEVALALVDVQMPGMDGFELAELMRGTERTQNVPIIFVTAGARDQQRIFKGYDSGAVDFLFKPIEAHILASKARVFFQLQQQKRQLAEQLQERSETLRMNEMFTAVLGHDLRGPLSAIMMSAQMLARRPDEPTQKVGQRLLRSGQWMSRMIEDMLDLTRARIGGGLPVNRQPHDLGELTERLDQERRIAFPGRHIEFVQHPSLAGHWDGDRISQVVSNLLGNALMHGDAAQPVEVCVDGRHAEHVVLSVTNGGVIPAELLPHLYNPFRSGREGASNRTEGLGLGLYIVQQVVHAHRGRIEAQTLPQGATRFEVTLPRQ
jgi:two-component system sensor histidine kinase/response regulator